MENNARLLLLSGNSICFTFLASKAVNGRAVELARLMVFMALVSTAQICPQIWEGFPSCSHSARSWVLFHLSAPCSSPLRRSRKFRIPFVPANTTSVSCHTPDFPDLATTDPEPRMLRFALFASSKAVGLILALPCRCVRRTCTAWTGQ